MTRKLQLCNGGAGVAVNPIAAPAMIRIESISVRGMISSTILTLIVIPAIYALVKERTLFRRQ